MPGLALARRVPKYTEVKASIARVLWEGAVSVEDTTSLSICGEYRDAATKSQAHITVTVGKFLPAHISVTTQVAEGEFTDEDSIVEHVRFLHRVAKVARDARGVAQVLVDRAEKGVL